MTVSSLFQIIQVSREDLDDGNGPPPAYIILDYHLNLDLFELIYDDRGARIYCLYRRGKKRCAIRIGRLLRRFWHPEEGTSLTTALPKFLIPFWDWLSDGNYTWLSHSLYRFDRQTKTWKLAQVAGGHSIKPPLGPLRDYGSQTDSRTSSQQS